MKKNLLNILKYIILLGVACALLLYALRGMDVKKVFQQISSANIFWVSVSGIISVIAFIVRAHRWSLLIEPMGYSPSLKNTTYSVIVGYFANLAFPRLGEVSRCGALNRAESIPFNKLLGTVIIERIIDVLSLLVCILLAATIEYKRLGNFFSEKIFDPLNEKFQKLTESPTLLTALILVFVILVGIAVYFIRKNKKKNSASGVNKIIRGFIDGLKSVGNLKRPGLFIFQSAFIWVLYFLGVYTALYAFSFTNDLGASAALFLLVAGGVGMSAPVQGGIGAYHLLVKEGLILYGVAAENGLAFAFVLHGLQMILVIALGIVSLFLLFSSGKTKQPIVEPKT
ncbi:MAG TPA: lysylphosphatidylglycerol synthase transmembrane domain-containing protein [Chitinophagaceae bacterium]|nr:lysylphosphatidylglycerol synthase transmembrane domain-containing protein [Chitinophagaceae bacterium]